MARVLVFGDTHFPAVHPKALSKLLEIRDKYECDTFVHTGDVVDNHFISSHPKNMETEANAVIHHNQTLKIIEKWYKEFPNVTVTIGNHDERVARQGAKHAGIPQLYFKEYEKLLNVPNWKFVHTCEIDDVFYTHGIGSSGLNPALNIAKSRGQSTVVGHYHSLACISWQCGPKKKIFGLTNGCLVNRKHPVMDYAETHINKPIIACSVILDGHPYQEILDI